MNRVLVVGALVLGCRDGRPHETGADRAGSAVRPAVVVPALPPSPDGDEELRVLDREIELHRSDPRFVGTTIRELLDRAAIRGDAADYQDALERSQQWVERAPTDLAAWKARAITLGRVHRFAAAREALDKAKRLTADVTEWDDIAATLDEATGQLAASAAYRERRAKAAPNSTNLTRWAASLALAGRFDDAIALIPRAAAELRDPSPITIAWLYFQWGRLYELRGEIGAARQFYEAAHARLPGSLEPLVHLAQTMLATGGDPRAVVADALTTNPHPELLALAGRIDEARAAWERYLRVLPEAFADHAARFYLGPGNDPKRARMLADANLSNRATADARALAVEAALAGGDPQAACGVAGPLATGIRAHQVLAWKAFAACGRSADADRLARTLGIR